LKENTFTRNLFAQAAAYAFHICQNHPFVDGNKRTALGAALVFLYLNGIELDDPKGELYELMMNVAGGQATKVDIANKFQRLTTRASKRL